MVLTSDVFGLLPFRCSVMPILKRFATQQYIGIDLKINETLPSVQRRKDIKVRLERMRAEIALLDIATGKPYGKTCEGIIEDISASGLLFITGAGQTHRLSAPLLPAGPLSVFHSA